MEGETIKITATSPAAAEGNSTTAVQSRNLRRRRNIKIAVVAVLAIVLNAVLFVVLDRTIFRIRRPNYKLNAINIENLTVDNSTNSPSFIMDFDAEISFRNRNFGPYEFTFGYLDFSYRGTRVGNAAIEGSSVKMYSSRSFNHKVKLNSGSVGERSTLRRDIVNGEIVLEVESELRGQVDLMKVTVLKKDRAVKLNCSLTVDLVQKFVKELTCA